MDPISLIAVVIPFWGLTREFLFKKKKEITFKQLETLVESQKIEVEDIIKSLEK